MPIWNSVRRLKIYKLKFAPYHQSTGVVLHSSLPKINLWPKKETVKRAWYSFEQQCGFQHTHKIPTNGKIFCNLPDHTTSHRKNFANKETSRLSCLTAWWVCLKKLAVTICDANCLMAFGSDCWNFKLKLHPMRFAVNLIRNLIYLLEIWNSKLSKPDEQIERQPIANPQV